MASIQVAIADWFSPSSWWPFTYTGPWPVAHPVWPSLTQHGHNGEPARGEDSDLYAEKGKDRCLFAQEVSCRTVVPNHRTLDQHRAAQPAKIQEGTCKVSERHFPSRSAASRLFFCWSQWKQEGGRGVCMLKKKLPTHPPGGPWASGKKPHQTTERKGLGASVVDHLNCCLGVISPTYLTAHHHQQQEQQQEWQQQLLTSIIPAILISCHNKCMFSNSNMFLFLKRN